MKLRNEIIISELDSGFVAVAADEASKYFHGMIKLNSTGVFITNCLKEETTEKEIAEKICNKYDVSEEKALSDVNKIVNAFKSVNLIVE